MVVRYLLSIFLLALWVSPSVFAANPASPAPDAGSILQQLQQEMLRRAPLPKFKKEAEERPQRPQTIGPGIRAFVRKLDFEGNESITSEALSEFLSDRVGKELSYTDMKRLALAIGEYYRGKGLWARAAIPAQSLEDGVLLLKVIEGQMGDIQIDFHDPDGKEMRFPRQKVIEYLKLGQEPGKIFSIHNFERAIKSLDAVPGITAAAILEPGAKVGQTDIVARIANKPPFAGSVRGDNHGSRSTGYGRITGYLNIDGVLEIGEQINLQAVHTRGTDVITIGGSYPLSVDGSRIGINYTDMRYELGKPLESLEGKGNSQATALYVSHPFEQRNDLIVNGQLSIGHTDYYNETVSGVSSDKTAKTLAGTLQVSWPDQLAEEEAVNNVTLIATLGDLDLSRAADNLASDATTAKTDGYFSKVNFTVTRNQTINEKTQFWFSLLGQYAFSNLDSGQKISLGGPSNVRAYPNSEGTGDHGAVMTLELRHMLEPNLQGQLFYDHGYVVLNKELWSDWN